MQRVPLSAKSSEELEAISKTILIGRYFKDFELSTLTSLLKQGQLLHLPKDEYLIKEGDISAPELYILLEGSLAVVSQSKFILRLEMPGDIAGEMSILSPGPRSADVLAETDCQIVAFSEEVFAVEFPTDSVSVFYLMFSHILAEKLRITTAQSLVRKNERVISTGQIKVAMIDQNIADRMIIRGVIESQWPEAKVMELDNPQEFIDNATKERFDLFILDVMFSHKLASQEKAIKTLLKATKIYGVPIFVISSFCNDVMNREWLMKMGVDDVLAKPFSIFDLKHDIVKFRVWYYKQRELDTIEHDADTDRLTGLANRRRLDEFLEALETVYPESQQPFSLIISDVDNFKHYNDSHGHQMGDVVLAGISAIFSQNVRKGDLAARFGGEEFVMVLPNCTKDNAIKVAEKLRKAVEDEEFPFQDQQPTGNLTATLGVATFPDDASQIHLLLKRADDCLYRGKAAGRNVVVAAE